MKPATKRLTGRSYRFSGRVDLHELAQLHDGHPVPHRHRLDLVMGHVDGGDAQVCLELGDVGPRLHPHFGVQVGQRLVHAEHLRFTDDGSPHRHPLPLTTRQCLRLALEVLGETQDLGGLGDAPLALLRVDLRHLQGEAHVVGHRHVRVQRVVLEHHRDVAVLRRQLRHLAVADVDVTVIDLLQAGEHPQRRGLATARRSDENHELAVLDLQVDARHGRPVRPGEPPLCLVESYGCHEQYFLPPAGTCRTIRVKGGGRTFSCASWLSP